MPSDPECDPECLDGVLRLCYTGVFWFSMSLLKCWDLPQHEGRPRVPEEGREDLETDPLADWDRDDVEE